MDQVHTYVNMELVKSSIRRGKVAYGLTVRMYVCVFWNAGTTSMYVPTS